MGRRGPKPKPDWVKELEGNPGKRPLKGALAETGLGRTTCPAWLSEGAKTEWKRLAPELERLCLLTALDRAAFAIYCQSLADWRDCQRMLDENGLVYVTPTGRVQEWPQVAMARQYLRATIEFGREFGLTPDSRSRLPLPEPEDDEEREFRKWLDR